MTDPGQQTVRPGRLIVLEGIDGAGTTTQATRLVDYLNATGRSAHLTREPTDNPVGLLLREILRGAHAPFDQGAMALLFAADRLDHIAREIAPRLAAGTHVVSDRYVLSSYAYQSRFCQPEWIWAINAKAPAADLTVLVDVSAEIAAARRNARGEPAELYEQDRLQRLIGETYRNLVGSPSVRGRGERVVVVDGTPLPDAVFGAILAQVETCLARARPSSSSL